MSAVLQNAACNWPYMKDRGLSPLKKTDHKVWSKSSEPGDREIAHPTPDPTKWRDGADCVDLQFARALAVYAEYVRRMVRRRAAVAGSRDSYCTLP